MSSASKLISKKRKFVSIYNLNMYSNSLYFRFDFLSVSLDKIGFFWGIINSDLDISIKDRKKMVFINKIFAN